ncbi:MAG: hypothetical protein ACPL3A_10845 [Thermoanaerobacteraceae bacterium]
MHVLVMVGGFVFAFITIVEVIVNIKVQNEKKYRSENLTKLMLF